MLDVWIYSLGSVLIVSLIAFIGIVFVSIKLDSLKKILLYMVSFATGALLGGAFLHLLPEAVEEAGFTVSVSLYVLLGIIIFFTVEKFIHWRHCHIPTSEEHPHHFAYMNLMGDSVHNFIDGLIIAASYLASLPLGIATTLAVILHEIPQEIGDFSVLVHGGFTRKKALLLNFLTALTAVAGAVFALIMFSLLEGLTLFLLPIAAGGFLYIASSDLIPELQKESSAKKSALQLLFLVLGMAVMFALLFLE